ncbi:MAG: hypothetical protein LBU87_03605 [Lactobacillales bacterium]|jgi:hypothetical protein|nr:hypothetical protein [Lactobacillales bacterium]
MKKSGFFYAVLFLVLGVFCAGIPARAFLLDEQVLETEDGKCKIRYLTAKNTQGWSIKVEPYTCPGGFLHGYADVTVYGPFSKPMEEIFGYFSNGYWTGDQPLDRALGDRSSEEYGVQKATFPLAKDTASDIQYIGQMTASKRTDGTYDSFKICHPFRMLAITPNDALFKNPHATQIILEDALKQAREICPDETRVLFFASSKQKPQQPDIFFFADMNLETNKTYVKRNTDARPTLIEDEPALALPASQPTPETPVAQPPMMQNINTSVPGPVSFPSYAEVPYAPVLPSGMQMQPGTIYMIPQQPFVVASPPILPPVTYMMPAGQITAAPTAEKEPETTENMDDWEPMDIPSNPENVSTAPVRTSVPKSVLPKQKPAEALLKYDAAAHLKLLSRVLRQPVYGAAVIHVDAVDFNEAAHADFPLSLKLYGDKVSMGWGIAEGYFLFSEKPAAGKPEGQVRVAAFTSCRNPFCADEIPNEKPGDQ